jgi:arginine/lysine/histidine transporter system substrate-binding protein
LGAFSPSGPFRAVRSRGYTTQVPARKLLCAGVAVAVSLTAGAAASAPPTGAVATAPQAGAAAAAPAAGAVAGSGADLARVKARGKLVVLVFPEQGSRALAVNLDTAREQGLKLADLRRPEHFTGAEVELLQGFARTLGVELEFRAVPTGLAALIQALAGGDGDLAGSGLTITPKRQEILAFSQPYYTTWFAVVVRRDSSIATAADLVGKTGAVVAGSSHLEVIKALAPAARLELAGFELESWTMVDEGKADFAVCATNAPPGDLEDTSLLHLKVAFRLRQLQAAIAVRKGSDLLAPLNAYLDEARRSGELDRILARHAMAGGKSRGARRPSS